MPKVTGMKRVIINIISLLLLTTAVLSCSAGLAFDVDDPGMAAPKMFPIEITGEVRDIDTGEALEDIRITVHANEEGETFMTKTTYTGNDGKFSITLAFDNYATTLVAIADDQKGVYESSIHEMLVSWNAVYNIDKGVFIIKGCDFMLKKQ